MRRVPMHRALVRPPMVLGCDRSLLFALGLFCLALILPAGISIGSPAMVALGVGVFSVGMVLLALMGAKDPQMFDVWRRAVHRGVGESLAQLGTDMARQEAQLPPTLEIRAGYRFSIMVQKDIPFPGAYEDGIDRRTLRGRR